MPECKSLVEQREAGAGTEEGSVAPSAGDGEARGLASQAAVGTGGL